MPMPVPPHRDLRLDFFRGLSLFIILIDHMRGNTLVHWTPGQFGYSDAACIFIFISGYTSALAFGSVYLRAGWIAGTARTAVRIWQIYIAQIAVVVVVAAIPSVVAHLFGEYGYGSVLKLDYLFSDPGNAFLGLVTLTYVPGYLDVLPVYVAMLAMVPLVVPLGRLLGGRALILLSMTLWVAARAFHWNLPADPTEHRDWFFDPFSWQFVFFTGFSLGMGWLRPPGRSHLLFWLAVGFLAFAAMTRIEPIYAHVPGLLAVHDWVMRQLNKTLIDPLEYLHFLAAAYVAAWLMADRLHWLTAPAARMFVVAGQQSLSVFLGTVVLADLGGIAFDIAGTGRTAQLAVNAACFAALAALGFTVAWFKQAPWKRPPAPAPTGIPATTVPPREREAAHAGGSLGVRPAPRR